MGAIDEFLAVLAMVEGRKFPPAAGEVIRCLRVVLQGYLLALETGDERGQAQAEAALRSGSVAMWRLSETFDA